MANRKMDEAAQGWRRGLFRRQAIEATCPCIIDNPESAVGSFLDVADSKAHVPTVGGLCSTVTIEGDSDNCFCIQAAREGGAIPLRKHTAVVEHEVAGSDDRDPVDD